MSLLTVAFDDLVTAINEARGTTPTITIGAVTANKILVGDNPVDPQIFDGALTDPDGPQISTKLADWGADIPEKNDSAVLAASSGADGTYDVMDTNIHDGMIYLKLGKRAGL